METQEHNVVDIGSARTVGKTRKSDGQDGPPTSVVENKNTVGALNSALNEPTPEPNEAVNPNHPCAAHVQILDREKAIVASTRKKFALCGFASSTRGAIPINDPDWEVIGLNQLYRHLGSSSPATGGRADRWLDIHHNWDSENVPGTDHRSWIRESGIPVYMIETHADLPTSVRFPIERLIEKFGDYYTSTVALMIALMIDEIDGRVEAQLMDEVRVDSHALEVDARRKALYDEFTIGIFGIDLVVGDEYFWQKACAEYYIGVAIGRGINVMIPPNSALCKQQFRYGWHTEPQQIIKPREVEKHKAMCTAERDELLKRLYMMEGALQVLDAPADATPKDANAIRKERDETMKRALMLEGALEADHYWGDLVELRLRGADVRI